MEITFGKHLSAVRGWIQRKCVNGDRVIWGSDDVLRLQQNLTPKLLEELSQIIRNAVIGKDEKFEDKMVTVKLTILQARALDIAAGNSLNCEEDAMALFADKKETVSAAYMAATKLVAAINKVDGYSEDIDL